MSDLPLQHNQSEDGKPDPDGDAGRETNEPLDRKDLVKGYEFKKNTYVLITDEDLQSLSVDSSSVMNIEKFIEAGSIDPLYYDANYFLGPDGDAGQNIYAVLSRPWKPSRRRGGRDNKYWPTCADEFWPTPGVFDLLSRA